MNPKKTNKIMKCFLIYILSILLSFMISSIIMVIIVTIGIFIQEKIHMYKFRKQLKNK